MLSILAPAVSRAASLSFLLFTTVLTVVPPRGRFHYTLDPKILPSEEVKEEFSKTYDLNDSFTES